MRIHHISITVKDVPKSILFYKINFGFKEIETYTKDGWDGQITLLELDNTRLELFHFPEILDTKDDLMDFKVVGIKHIGIEVKSVDEKYQELKAAGVDIDEPGDGTRCKRYCFLRDPDGIPIELFEP